MTRPKARPNHVDVAARVAAEFDDHRRRAAFEEDQRRVTEDWQAMVAALPAGRCVRRGGRDA